MLLAGTTLVVVAAVLAASEVTPQAQRPLLAVLACKTQSLAHQRITPVVAAAAKKSGQPESAGWAVEEMGLLDRGLGQTARTASAAAVAAPQVAVFWKLAATVATAS